MGTTNTITPDTVIVRNDKKFITSLVGDEIVMMSMDSGNYIGMNSVGSTIWEQLQQPRPVKDLISYLLTTYNISAEECERKTLKYLEDMKAQEMLIIIN